MLVAVGVGVKVRVFPKPSMQEVLVKVAVGVRVSVGELVGASWVDVMVGEDCWRIGRSAGSG